MQVTISRVVRTVPCAALRKHARLRIIHEPSLCGFSFQEVHTETATPAQEIRFAAAQVRTTLLPHALFNKNAERLVMAEANSG